MALTLIFKDQILKKLYLRSGEGEWHWTKLMWIDRMLDLLCDLELWPSLTLDFDGHSFKKLYPRVGWRIGMERKGYGSIACWTNFATSDLQYGLPVGDGTYQIHWPSRGLMQNCYSFQPVGSLMDCPFSDLWAERCCRSLNVLFIADSYVVSMHHT